MARGNPAFALRHGVSSAADNAALLVATLDLSLVQSLRGAMRAADIASGRPQPVAALGPAPTPPPDRLVREPQFAMRPVYHPEPRYERRMVYHPEARVVLSPPVFLAPEVAIEPVPPERKPEVECPLAPPWKSLPWQTPIAPFPKVKLVKIRPDIVNKGSLIDFFI